jgi:hypothetical protein
MKEAIQNRGKGADVVSCVKVIRLKQRLYRRNDL